MSTPTTQVNTRGGKGTTNPPTDTAKQNYTAQTIGKNEKGSVWLGPIHKQGDVTSAVVLRNEQDRTHQLCLDIDGERPGSTTSTSPGKLQLDCGDNMKEAEESCLIHAHNGNIVIKASNGKIRMEATDIEIVTKGDGETKGHLKLNIDETIEVECKKLVTSSQVLTKMCSAGDFEQAANGVLSTYASLLSSITDAVFKKPSKFGGQRERQKNNLPSASDADVASLDRGAKAQQYNPDYLNNPTQGGASIQ